MPDLKISQLPVATTPLAGTELVPLVQGGVTVQSTVDKVLTGTVPSGTANGVLFLNGSKVVTSGSALTFDGSTVGVFGGTTVNYRFNANRGTDDTSQGLRFGYGGIDAYRTNQLLSAPMTSITLTQTGSDGTRTGYELNSSGQSVWSVAGTEQMRLDSTGLGIGTSSPNVKLTVQGDGNFRVDSGNVGIALTGSGWAYSNYFNAADNSLRWFSSTGGDRMVLDSSGNLGLGVTPSAWSLSGLQALQIKNASLAGYLNNAYLSANAFFAGGWLYAGSGLASQYVQADGEHRWFTAPSGTAGNAITFTQAMTLDASGNLLVGTTSSPAYGSKLRVEGGIETFAPQFNVASGTSAQFELVNRSASAGFDFYVNSGGILAARIPAAGGMVVGTAALATSATDGFLYVPTCAGTPTGTPTTQTGTAPIVVNTTNNKLYFYSGGQWRDAGP